MCGLAGVMGTLNLKDMEVFTELLFISQLRGYHSTGIATVTHGKNVEVHKAGYSAADFIGSKKYDKLMGVDKRLIIGHCRHATIGKINGANAHPFDFTNIVGAHNGTLRNKHVLENAHDFDTDSEALYHTFNLNEGNVGKVIPEVNGAYALTWYDKQKHTFNMLRNKERTLYFTYSKNGEKMYWASEAGMLDLVLTRNNIEYEKVGLLKEDTWCVMPLPKSHGDKINKCHLFEVKGKKDEQRQWPVRYWHGGGGMEGAYIEASDDSVITLPSNKDNKDKKNNVVPLKSSKTTGVVQGTNTLKTYYKDNQGRIIKKTEFYNRTKQGCMWCSHVPEWGEEIHWFANDEFLCCDCGEDEEVLNYLTDVMVIN